MLKVFIEYTIIEKKRDMFFLFIPKMRDHYNKNCGVKSYEIYEGNDQPNLIVEEIFVKDKNTYERIKNERQREEVPLSSELHRFIKGGKDKENIWLFTKL